MRCLFIIVALCTIGCSLDLGEAAQSAAPGVSLTCRWAPRNYHDIEEGCYRVESRDGNSRVTLAGDTSCPEDNQTCAIGGPGDRILMYTDQLTYENTHYWEGYVDCSSTCDTEW